MLATDSLNAFLDSAGPIRSGVVRAVSRVSVTVTGLGAAARLGDTVNVEVRGGIARKAQITSADGALVTAACFSNFDGVAIGDRVILAGDSRFVSPSEAWIGKVIDPFGRALDGSALPVSGKRQAIDGTPPPAVLRKAIGERLPTGLSVFDTFLPLVRGQRLGIFAGPGVGKSTLLGDLARGVSADIVVIALIGERSREVNHFLGTTLGPEMMKKSVIVASTADEAPIAKKRGAQLALTTAEYFRDNGRSVLLIFDSLTRFAEAHREIALGVGEPPTLHGYPPSTFRELASLVERSGPGLRGSGDITAIFSVLVEGGELETAPAADAIRGILDGHVILDRHIAERGRFPAVDVLRSVSRSLPGAATQEENGLLREARRLLGLYEDSEMIIRAGLHTRGADPKLDEAIQIWPALDAFIGARSEGVDESFAQLEETLKSTSKQ